MNLPSAPSLQVGNSGCKREPRVDIIRVRMFLNGMLKKREENIIANGPSPRISCKKKLVVGLFCRNPRNKTRLMAELSSNQLCDCAFSFVFNSKSWCCRYGC
ncbi:uncharacterized protein TM35_000064460 [Trypanosoma theileri]|uniref:Uncharacterized protein n=1 Tax=Trypanosoma theileri TaxID=67003 RepID=A0A1X0P3K7_9TRYP|nr:uncharacterized protein TM35_000064460 [Trypanosoma theileri]ORC91441.1 hypothetical protein TM35_000064460 [Trypanosoma theileri]